MTRTVIRGLSGAMTLALVVVAMALTGCAETIPKPPNSAPVADAGPDQTVTAGDTVTLQGSGADAENDSLTYSWSQTGAPSVELRNANHAAASFIAPAIDADTLLTFTLSVTDSGGLTGSDTVTVTVQPKPPEPPPNSPPTADAGRDQTVTAGDTVTLQGSGTDAEDDSLIYSWSQTGGGPPVELRNANQAAASFIAPAVDADTMLTFTLSVTDSGGLSGADTVTVTVMPALSVGFAEDSVRVAEGEEVSVGIRYRVRELASPLDDPGLRAQERGRGGGLRVVGDRFRNPGGAKHRGNAGTRHWRAGRRRLRRRGGNDRVAALVARCDRSRGGRRSFGDDHGHPGVRMRWRHPGGFASRARGRSQRSPFPAPRARPDPHFTDLGVAPERARSDDAVGRPIRRDVGVVRLRAPPVLRRESQTLSATTRLPHRDVAVRCRKRLRYPRHGCLRGRKRPIWNSCSGAKPARFPPYATRKAAEYTRGRHPTRHLAVRRHSNQLSGGVAQEPGLKKVPAHFLMGGSPSPPRSAPPTSSFPQGGGGIRRYGDRGRRWSSIFRRRTGRRTPG